MKPRILLALFVIPLGLIIAAVPQKTMRHSKVPLEVLLDEVNTGSQFLTTDYVAEKLNDEDPTLLLIDVRAQDEYDKYHLPGAINIPLHEIINPENEDLLNPYDATEVILYSNGNTKANEAWILTRQLGYINNFVMMGGLNHYFETIMNPQKPASTSPDDEFAKYNFRQSVGKALGGGGAIEADSSQQITAPKPILKTRPKKKKVEGGC